MRQWEVYVEGNSDEHCLSYIAKHMRLDGLAWQAIGGGVSRLQAMDQAMLQSHRAGRHLAVIVDANANPAMRRRELDKTIAGMSIPADISTFLLPNNSDPGCLETLLEAMAVKSHRAIYECFNGYRDCLEGHDVGYHMPDAKARIYAYCNALGIEAQPTKRDYADPNHWNLDAPELEPLKQFLRSLN